MNYNKNQDSEFSLVDRRQTPGRSAAVAAPTTDGAQYSGRAASESPEMPHPAEIGPRPPATPPLLKRVRRTR